MFRKAAIGPACPESNRRGLNKWKVVVVAADVVVVGLYCGRINNTLRICGVCYMYLIARLEHSFRHLN